MTFVYASPAGAASGSLAGVVNHTEAVWWSYTVKKLIGYRGGRILACLLFGPIAAIILSLVVFPKYVDWRFASINAQLPKLEKGIEDWNQYNDFRQARRSTISVEKFAAQYRPSMDYSLSQDEYIARRNPLLDEWYRLKLGSYQFWILTLGAAVFLVALVLYILRRQSVEADVARALQHEIRKIASMSRDEEISSVA
ncbi:hypothetical protein DB459_21090 [Bradyrhizobium sp. WD16]|nr:hypothetical protein DB459_21090 [Bradyrhizobium sp. WD16]